jgi:hypothetical protein
MKNRLICCLVVSLALPALLVAKRAEKVALVGVWEMAALRTGMQLPPLLGIITFSEDGTLTTTAGNPIKDQPIPVLQDVADEMDVGYGRWIQTGEREFRATFYITLLKAGAVNGFSAVNTTIALSESGDEFTAHSEGNFLDAKWNVLLSVASELKGTRLETP